MQKKRLNRSRSETVVVRGTVTSQQRDVLQQLIGVLGSNEQDVVSKILTLWIYNEGFLKNETQSIKRGI